MLVAQLTILLAVAAQAKDLSPEDFYGYFVGTGFTHGDFDYYESKVRDLNVQIGREKGGFYVAWTSIFRPPGDKKPRRKGSLLKFVPTQRPGIYIDKSAGEDNAKGLAWAAIKSRRLKVSVLAILDDGSYDIQTYTRTLVKKGMTLQFKSDHNGKTIRMISGHLAKIPSQSSPWFAKTLAEAECGDGDAQFELGEYYHFSLAREFRDRIDAFVWYSLASKRGHPEVAGALDLLAVEMSSKNIKKAKKQIAEWERSCRTLEAVKAAD
jgi:hypothetical protein